MTPEILAPCGGKDSILSAVNGGADAVYIGGKSFSARASAKNFIHEEMAEAVRFCHLHGVKVYRAMNTVLFDSERAEFADEVRFCAEIGFDGLIIQDIGALALAASLCDIPLHASTQMTVACPSGARLALLIGCRRVVAARELDIRQIKKMAETAPTEVFVHGAQCMCLSGQCYMSAMIGGRSANRGCCAQSCRLPFSKGKRFREGEYALSLKDLSFIGDMDELVSAGVVSLKIEGRMKSPEYTYEAARAVSRALNGEYTAEDEKRLAAVFSRQGFTDGYLHGRVGREMFGRRTYEDVNAVREKSTAEPVPEKKAGTVDFDMSITENEPVSLRATVREKGISASVRGDVPQRAVSRSITAEDAAAALSKTGGTAFEAGDIRADTEEGLFLPRAALNDIRRKAIGELEEKLIRMNTPVYTLREKDITAADRKPRPMEYRYYAENAGEAEKARDFDRVLIPLDECAGCSLDPSKLIAVLPSLFDREESVAESIEKAVKMGITSFWAENFSCLGVLVFLRERFPGIKIHTGQGLNVTNFLSAEKLRELGVQDVLLSMEMKLTQIRGMKKPLPAGLFVYGRPVLMTVRNHPGDRMLTDRTGRTFEVADRGYYSNIYNCDTIDIIQKAKDLGLSYLLARDGEPSEVLRALKSGESRSGKGFTNGLYIRGIV